MLEKDDWNIYIKELNKNIRAQKIQTSSAKMYISALQKLDNTLKMRGVTDRIPSSSDMEQAIRYLAGGRPSVIKEYKCAIYSYSKLVWHDKFILLNKEARQRLDEMSKLDIVEPLYDYDTQVKKINSIKRKEIMLALRFQLACGIRISEILELRKKDINFEKRAVFVRRDKGGGSKVAYLEPNDWLDEQMREFTKDMDSDEQIFKFREKTVYKYTEKIHIKSHDNRRHYIRKRFQERVEHNMEKGMTKYKAKSEALGWIQKLIGHSDKDITKRYLGSAWRKVKPVDRKYMS